MLCATALIVGWSGCSPENDSSAQARALLLSDAQVAAAVPTAERLGADQAGRVHSVVIDDCGQLIVRAWSVPAVEPMPQRDAAAVLQEVVSCSDRSAARACAEQMAAASGERLDVPMPNAVQVRLTVGVDGNASYLGAAAKGTECTIVSYDLFTPPTAESAAQTQALAGAIDDLVAAPAG